MVRSDKQQQRLEIHTTIKTTLFIVGVGGSIEICPYKPLIVAKQTVSTSEDKAGLDARCQRCPHAGGRGKDG